MVSPLSPAPDTLLNSASSMTNRRYDDYEIMTAESNTTNQDTLDKSQTLINANEANVSDQENVSPSKSKHSRVLSGTELSPLRIVESQRSSLDGVVAMNTSGVSTVSARSPRKMSPERRFPVKISMPIETPTRTPHERSTSLEAAVRDNEGLKRAIEIFEDEHSVLEAADNSTATVHMEGCEANEDEAGGADDTMISTSSTFSALPNLTLFAKLGQTPSKMSDFGDITTPKPKRETSPAKRTHHAMEDDSGNTTNLLMDFTEHLRYPKESPAKRAGLSPSRTTSNVAATPSRQLTNLIDFDIPPLPTPRSLPTVTPRELESLKSSFMSEISSLKASLSGKEAEVQSLKSAVGDAEKRVGESMEQLREERGLKEQLAAEREGWENRGREMENMIRKIREEIVLGQREREELESQLEESEKRREAAEMMHQEAESKLAGMRAGKDSDKQRSPEKPKSPESNNREVEIAVERVAFELHALYKSKHETKVAALKKSYENRWEKKVKELETKIEELNEENEKLRLDRDVTMTKVDPADVEERKAQAVRDSAAIKELEADVQRLEAVVSTVQLDNEELRGKLEHERVEKGELVQLAEELMSMQSFVSATPAPQRQQPLRQPQPPSQSQPQQQQQQQQQQQERAEAVAKTPKANPTVRGGSGLRAPGTVLRAPHERTKSGGGGLPRPGARSGIMSSIEKMGNYRGRGTE